MIVSISATIEIFSEIFIDLDSVSSSNILKESEDGNKFVVASSSDTNGSTFFSIPSSMSHLPEYPSTVLTSYRSARTSPSPSSAHSTAPAPSARKPRRSRSSSSSRSTAKNCHSSLTCPRKRSRTSWASSAYA